MRIAVISNLYPPRIRGGAEVSASVLVEELLAGGHEVHLFTLSENSVRNVDRLTVSYLQPKRPYDAFKDQQVSKVSKALWHLIELSDGSSARFLYSELKAFGPDAVFTQNLTGIGAWSVHKLIKRLPRKIPVIHTLRDYGLLCIRNTRYHNGKNSCAGHLLCSIRRLVSRFSTSRFSGVVGISQFVLDAHFDAGLFRRIPSAVIPNKIEIPNPPPEKQRHGIGYLGRLSEEKGVFDLVDAYRAWANTLEEVPPLLLAGEGSEVEVLKLRARAQNLQVKFLGSTNAIEFLSSIQYLVVPSRWHEPFGRVVIEAAALGTPLLVSDAGGIPEVVTSLARDFARHCVVVFERGKVESLTDGLNSMSNLAAVNYLCGDPGHQELTGPYLRLIDACKLDASCEMS